MRVERLLPRFHHEIYLGYYIVVSREFVVFWVPDTAAGCYHDALALLQAWPRDSVNVIVM
jgi:hypothetical protein